MIEKVREGTFAGQTKYYDNKRVITDRDNLQSTKKFG